MNPHQYRKFQGRVPASKPRKSGLAWPDDEEIQAIKFGFGVARKFKMGLEDRGVVRPRRLRAFGTAVIRLSFTENSAERMGEGSPIARSIKDILRKTRP